LFHPANSVALGVSTGNFSGERDLTSYLREGGGADYLANWSADTELQNGIFEAVGVPDSLISGTGRVTGGVMTVKVTGAPSSTGYVVSSCPQSDELKTHKTLYDAHQNSVRLKRHDIGEGTRDFAFHAPLFSPALVETYVPVIASFHWCEHDPFGGIALTFHELNYNDTLGMPFIVEVDMQVGIQCRLDLADRHLSTSHPHEKAEVKKDLHNERNMGLIGASNGALSKKVQDSAMIRDTTGIK